MKAFKIDSYDKWISDEEIYKEVLGRIEEIELSVGNQDDVMFSQIEKMFHDYEGDIFDSESEALKCGVEMKGYKVFTRNWWKISNGVKVPDPKAIKTILTYVGTEIEAREICKEYNKKNDAGALSRKAEYEDIQ